MKSKLITLLLALLYRTSQCKETANNDTRKIPNNFMFGASTSAYQVEGAWNVDGKSVNIWDHLVHSHPNPVLNNATGDVADSSYYLYKKDVEMARELGLDFYRFSISWTRLMPTSFPNFINPAGVQYYNNLINELLKHNIQPLVTIYHWDLPQKLQELGGWANPDIVNWFADYARVVFQLFGDRVKYWITINEAKVICHFGYGLGILAPRLNYSGEADYMCARNVLLAHAKVYHMYDKEFRSTQNGSISMSIVGTWYEPAEPSFSKAAEDAFQFSVGEYAHPIFSKAGGWPPAMVERIGAKSKEQGFVRSRLPPFTPEEVAYVRGTADFFGLNHYTTEKIYKNQSTEDEFPVPSKGDDLGVGKYESQQWMVGDATVPVHPLGMYKILMKIKKDYGNPTVFITENGYGSTDLVCDDDERVSYLRQYLSAVMEAVAHGADVRAYTVWSLMDNFQWIAGYTSQFGLYAVNYNDPQLPRTPRKSAFVYKHILRTRTIDPNYEPDTTVMTVD